MVKLWTKISFQASGTSDIAHSGQLSWVKAEREKVAHSMQAEGLLVSSVSSSSCQRGTRKRASSTLVKGASQTSSSGARSINTSLLRTTREAMMVWLCTQPLPYSRLLPMRGEI